MGAKRFSDVHCIVGVDKPPALSSHDVVNRVRSIFSTRRVGHTGTLDPMATGVLLIEVGSATRLSTYLINKDKRYLARFVFGAATDTDDGEGSVIHEAAVASAFADPDFACATIAALRGPSLQLPPVYSAIKRQGKKSYEQARAGHVVALDPRPIEIYSSELMAIGCGDGLLWSSRDNDSLGFWDQTTVPPSLASRSDLVFWDVDLHVSKGTYIRSIARDVGQSLQSFGFIGALRRVAAGTLRVDECVSLEALADLKERAALDPIPLLGLRYGFVDEVGARAIAHGQALLADRFSLYEGFGDATRGFHGCAPALRPSDRTPKPGEYVAAIAEDRVIALLVYDGELKRLQPRCVLQGGVIRGRAV